jgi:hypothetical protein
MSVASILEAMAANAGARQLARGALIGNTISNVAAVPGQILEDRRRQDLVDQENARRAGQDARQARGDARDEAAFQTQQRQQAIAHAVATVYHAGTPNDPTTNDLPGAIAKANELGAPELIPGLKEAYRKDLEAAQPKITQLDPAKDTYSNGVLTTPAQPKQMTPAEQAQRDETARHNKETERLSGLTEGRTEAALKETARHNRATEANAAKTADPLGGQGGATAIDLDKLPPPVRDQAQALVDGRRQLDPRLASKPLGQTIINAAYAIDPTFDQGNYNARYKARTDLTNPGGTGGKTISALNTAIQHAGKLSDLIETLDNSNYPMVNAVLNPLKSAGGSTAVTNFDTVAPQLAKEIERVWRGAGGTAGEIKDLIETIGHNKGKQQQREALQQFVELAKGKLDTVEQQRDNVMGKKAGATIPILFDQNKPIMDTIAQRASGSALISVTDPQGGVHQFPTQAKADAFKQAAGIK